jgi:gliding motility-associated-like protein
MKYFFLLVSIFVIGFSVITTSSFSQLNAATSKVAGVSKNTNACGVIASFTPDNDSLVSGFFNVTFTSTSTNAKSVTWYINGWWNSTSNTFSFGSSQAGIYEVRLVASNGTCSDTTSCFYFYPGEQSASRKNIKGYYGLPSVNDYSTSFIALKEGGYLIGGYSHINGYDRPEKGLLMKISESGCIVWTKILPTHNNATGRVDKLIELKDGGYVISGYNADQPYLLKLDNDGNFLWSKKYTLEGQNFSVRCITTTSDGGLVLVGQYWANALGVVRTNAAGEVIWGRIYKKPSSLATYYNPMDVLQKGNDIYITGSVWETVTGSGASTHSGIVIKLQDITGATVWTKNYLVDGYRPLLRDIHLYGEQLLINATDAFGKESTFHNTFMILDTDGKVLKSTTLSTPNLKFSQGTSVAMPMENGDIYFLNSGTETLNLQPYFTYHSNFIKIDGNNKVKWGKEYGHRGGGRYFFGAIGQEKTFAAIGDEWGSSLATYGSLADKIQFKKVDSLGGFDEPACSFYDLSVSLLSNDTKPISFNWTTDSTVIFTAKDSILPVSTVYGQVRYVCPKEFIDSCNFIKVTGVSSVCNLSAAYTFRTHRNKACNEPVVWDVPAGTKIIDRSDTAITVKFASFGEYKISASLPYTCNPVKDSLIVTVASRTPPLNIGADTSLCSNNTMTLHAGPKFLAYKWHDGSRDSLFAVTKPGTFWVVVSDSCGNILSDTINVAAAASVPLSVGADRIKCNDDTIKLQAPDGFLNYKWSGNYNISSTTAQSVVVNPAVDTAYYLKAEKTPGCFGFDTIRIKVNKSPAIKLGNDTVLCTNQHLRLNAGSGFTSYLWNNGNVSQTSIIQNSGVYSVMAKDANGCVSRDTINVNTQITPVFDLGRDTVLCNGDKILLQTNVAGKHLWQDGSIAPQLNVTKEGLYWLEISDKGCASRDSIVISFKPLPIFNLGNDTTICEGVTKILTINPSYTNIRWGNNSSSSAYSVSNAGTYWAKVTLNGCSFSDTIIILQKLKPLFTLGRDTFLCIGQTLPLKVNVNANSYLWSTGSVSRFFTVTSPGTYKATATNECASFTDDIVVNIGVCNIEMPTAFTPNNDYLNDVFRIKYPQSFNSIVMRIFDRGGQQIFVSKDPQKGWDGTIRGVPLNTGNYVWTITYETKDGVKGNSQGNVLLIR